MNFVIADRYELGANIGSGGMSEVFAATDSLIGREVAVKMLRIDLAKDATFRERFRREAQNSGKLSHPCIVAVFDTGEVDRNGISVPYIVMELVNGRNLRDIVREDGVMTPKRAAEVMIPVCEALQASHDAGIIHRDVKPANIMITNTGGVKVMDFGIARALDDSTSAMTQTSAVIGTAQYLSPEQARGKPADARSDVYATGCVLYEILTGRPPFEGESPFAVAYQHVQEEPTPPSAYIADLTPTAALNVDAVVLTAMAKHPADRYQSASEMAADLKLLARNAVSHAARSHVAEGPTQSLAATPPTSVTTPRPSHKRTASRGRRWLAALAIILTLAVIGVAGAFSYDFFSNRSTEATQQIPDVVGLRQDEAIAQLQQLGFDVSISEEPSPDVAEGLVLRTSPTVGSDVRSGATITVTVSSGREIVSVPDVTGLTLEEAASALEQVGLSLNQTVRQQNSDEISAGDVISQSPEAGESVSAGTSVSLTVSTGATQVRVPVITGMRWEQAEGNLTSLGFVPQLQYVDSMEPEGEILSVSDEGNQLNRGSTVTVQISNGMLINAPDLARMTREEAIAALRSAGWTGPDSAVVTGDPIPTAALVDQNTIGLQTPSPDSPIRKDATVTVRLYQFTLGALVPSEGAR